MQEIEARPQWIVAMRPRSSTEAHRAATPLELFFDLVIVVAVAQAASALHHGIAEAHALEAVVGYCMVFFGIWWAWMNFTWFASSYDNNDIPYRLLVFVQMTGALIIASGVERVVNERDLTLTVVGYVVMRLASVVQWLRAAYSDAEHRPSALRYVAGITLCQVAWIILLFLPVNMHVPGFIFLAVLEVLVPVWAEMAAPTTWHPHHIRERYGLFTILVLGESILSTSIAIQSANGEGGIGQDLIIVIIGGLLIVYAMWWLYFYQHVPRILNSIRTAFVWGYGHLFIFGASAAVGAGLAVVIDQVTHHAEISAIEAGMAVALPSAIYVFFVWLLHEHPRSTNPVDTLVHPATAFLILLTPFTGQAVILTGLLMTGLVIIRLVRHLE
jgi:low temperature requirement protein LtrA